tara:strand:+ start:5005 stop:5244 length:240 start_codon:yes stop_codon:yes gene_type:complete
MIAKQEIIQRIQQRFDDAEVHVEDPNGDGYKIHIDVKTKAFAGLNRVKQHQAIMALFNEELRSGKMHAISLNTAIKKEE